MQLRSVENLEVSGRQVIMRVDYNVSLGRTLKVVDDTRLTHTLPTIEYLLSHNVARLCLIAHLGKPGGQHQPKLSLAPVAIHLSELLGQPVSFCQSIAEFRQSQSRLCLLENLRFDPREEAGSLEMARELATGFDAYVNEAFGESHREATSITYLPQVLPSYAGFGLIEEVTTILKNLAAPTRPLVVAVGGAKVADKLSLLQVLARQADYLLIGGGMANTFLAAQGHTMGESRVEPELYALAKELLSDTTLRAKIVLPQDVVVGKIDAPGAPVVVPVAAVPPDAQALDIGPSTTASFREIISSAKTIIWNGPMGYFEDARYRQGTTELYRALTANEPAFVIVGGGDTLTAINDHRDLHRLDFVSTGGGAMLSLIEQGTLPALKYLSLT